MDNFYSAIGKAYLDLLRTPSNSYLSSIIELPNLPFPVIVELLRYLFSPSSPTIDIPDPVRSSNYLIKLLQSHQLSDEDFHTLLNFNEPSLVHTLMRCPQLSSSQTDDLLNYLSSAHLPQLIKTNLSDYLTTLLSSQPFTTSQLTKILQYPFSSLLNNYHTIYLVANPSFGFDHLQTILSFPNQSASATIVNYQQHHSLADEQLSLLLHQCLDGLSTLPPTPAPKIFVPKDPFLNPNFQKRPFWDSSIQHLHELFYALVEIPLPPQEIQYLTNHPELLEISFTPTADSAYSDVFLSKFVAAQRFTSQQQTLWAKRCPEKLLHNHYLSPYPYQLSVLALLHQH